MLKLKNIKPLWYVLAFVALLLAPLGSVSTVGAQSCDQLSGESAQSCQTRIDNCNNLASEGEARFIDECRSSVYRDVGLIDSEGNPVASSDPGRGANLEANCKPANGAPLDQENCGIIGYILLVTNILSAIVGIVIVIMIAVGGIQYATSGDNPQMVSGAKERIRNAILALIFYLFVFAFLQYLVPGGIF